MIADVTTLPRTPETARTTETAASEDAVASVEEQLAVLIMRFRSRMRQRGPLVHPELQPTGYAIVTTLVRCGPTHGRRLADMLGIDKSSVSRQITAMEGLGLVEREIDPADGRAYFLVASAEAKRKVAQIRATDQVILRAHLRNWDENDVPKFAQLLASINEITV